MNNFITVMSQNTDVTNSMFTMLIPFVIIIFFFYFLLIRPQKKKDKEHPDRRLRTCGPECSLGDDAGCARTGAQSAPSGSTVQRDR